MAVARLIMSPGARMRTKALPTGSDRESLVRSRRYTLFRWDPHRDTRSELPDSPLLFLVALRKLPRFSLQTTYGNLRTSSGTKQNPVISNVCERPLS